MKSADTQRRARGQIPSSVLHSKGLFKGWIVLACCFCMTFTIGLQTAYSDFFLPFSKQFGWNYATVSIIGSVLFVTFSFGTIIRIIRNLSVRVSQGILCWDSYVRWGNCTFEPCDQLLGTPDSVWFLHCIGICFRNNRRDYSDHKMVRSKKGTSGWCDGLRISNRSLSLSPLLENTSSY